MKPGYKTTEFWLSFAAVLIGGLVASGVFPESSGVFKMLAVGASTLSAMGYTVARTWAKSSTESGPGALVVTKE